MSGDVQPRKRKDKKRRKDDEEPIPVQAHAPIFTNNLVNDDVNIHVHKEGGTGGGICAKLVFFILLSALAVLVGLIITEHRGLTDLEAADYDSKFSQIFEGWIDTGSNNHDDHELEDSPHADQEDEHDDDQEELDVSEAEDDHQTSQEEEEHQQSEEDEEQQHSEEDEEPERSEEEVEEAENDSLEEEDADNEDRDEEYEVDEGKYSEEDDEDVQNDNSYEIDRVDAEEPDEDLDESREHSDEIGDKVMQASDEEEQDQNDDNELDTDEESKEVELKRDEMVDEGDEDGGSQEQVDDETANEEDISTEKSTRIPDDKKIVVSSAEEAKVSEKKLSTHDIEAEIPETSNSINSPRDQVGDSDSDRQSDDVEYEHMNITNKDDFKIRHEIDEAQKAVENNPNYAIRLFDTILQKFPSSPRSLYGKALALDRLADQKRSNTVLEEALKLYLQLLRTENVSDGLFELAAERCLNRMRFLGQYTKAILVHKQVIDRFPNIPKHLNDMAVTYLTINRIDDARSILKRVLAKWPNDAVALVHYGFILKTADNELESAVFYLNKGIRTKEKGALDGRFFFHLGDALTRLGRTGEAMKVYEQGTELKVFLSKYQRSLYNVPRLTGRPWWQPTDFPYVNSFKLLKNNWRRIRDEALSVLNVKGYFQDESENLKDTASWIKSRKL